MNEPNDNERLLRDIFAEEGDADLRETLLLQTLSLARRRRRFRQVRAAASVLVVIASLGLLLWRSPPPKPTLTRQPPLHYTLIGTHPLARAAFVKTEPLPFSNLIASVPTA